MIATIDNHEQVRVNAWVLERLLALGFPAPTAFSLMRAGVDWHRAEHLIRDLDYTPEQAARLIL